MAADVGKRFQPAVGLAHDQDRDARQIGGEEVVGLGDFGGMASDQGQPLEQGLAFGRGLDQIDVGRHGMMHLGRHDIGGAGGHVGEQFGDSLGLLGAVHQHPRSIGGAMNAPIPVWFPVNS